MMDEYDSFDHRVFVTWEILAGVIFVSLIIGQNEIAGICTFPLLFTIGYFFVRRKLEKKK